MTKIKTKIRNWLILLVFLMTISWTLSAEYYSYLDFSGGLNDKYSNVLIADNQAAAMRNIDLSTSRGSMQKRHGFTIVCPSMITTPTGYEVNGLFDYQKGDGSSYIIACSSNTITKLSAGDTSWTTICSTSSIVSGDYYDFCIVNNTADDTDSLIITDGISIPKKYNGGAVTENIGTGTDPNDRRPNYAQYCEKYANRLVFGGKMQEADGGVAGAITYNRIRLSGYYGYPNIIEGAYAWPADWTYTISDEKITGMKTFNGALVVFGLDSINELRGEYYGSSNSLVMRQVKKGTGCISDRTIQQVDNELYFLDRSGNIYSYDGSGVDLKSDNIATTIAGLNKAYLTKACAVYYPKLHQYRIEVANGTSTTNNLELVYDTLLQAWMPNSGINSSAIALVERSNSLYLYSGDASGGYVYRLDNGDIDYPLGVATGIDAYYTTKYFSVPLAEQEKIFDSIYLNIEQSGAYNLTVTSKMDFEKTQNTQLVDLNPGGALWDSAVWDADTWAGDSTILIKKLSISKAANFMSLTFSNSNYSQPFKIYGFGLRVNTIELR